jgi:hypothetical protein
VGSRCGFGLALLEQRIQVGAVVDDGSALPKRGSQNFQPVSKVRRPMPR